MLIVLSVAIGVGARRALRARRAGALVPERALARRRSCSCCCSCSASPVSKLAFPDEAQRAHRSAGVTQRADRGGAARRAALEHAGRTSTTSSTPSATRASPSWPATPPGSRTRTRSTTPPSAPSRRSWTATCPRRTRLPISSDHPNSIFSLFAKTPPAERVRGGHLGLLARPLQGHPPRRVLRQTASRR